MKYNIILTILLTLPMTSIATTNTLTLKSVMQGLEKSMNNMNTAIFNADYIAIEKAAQEIASHPKPKSELSTIVKTLNIRLFSFKSLDGRVQDSAVEIAKLAKKKDMSGILKKHTIIINNCVKCHTEFRDEISKALAKK